MTTYVRDVSTAEFRTAVVERSVEVPVVVDFWAEWCGPCKVLGPMLERLADEGGGAWELAKIDVDQNQQLAQQFGVQGIPAVVAFRDGQPVSQFTGALPEAQVREFLAGLLPSELDVTTDQGYAALDSGDQQEASRIWSSVLESDPAHEGAGLGLASLLMEKGEVDAAQQVLARLAPTEPVRQFQAALRLSTTGDLESLEAAAAGGDPAASLELAKALAGAGRHEEALERLVEVVTERDEDHSDAARLVMLDLFELLGPEHPLTLRYRKRLASALF